MRIASDTLAIVGIGRTVQGEHPGRTAASLSVEALGEALADAGIHKGQINGLITCKQMAGDGNDELIASTAGISPQYSTTLDYGTCNFSLHQAQMVLRSGFADTIALTYGTNQRTDRFPFAGGRAPGAGAFTTPYGFVHVAGQGGMALRRWRHLYGTTEEEFAHIALSQREWARLNPIAIFDKPMTMDDYLSQPYLVDPLRRADITMISDGGVSLIVTRADRAAEYTDTPIYLAGMAQVGATGSTFTQDDTVLRGWLRDVGDRVFQSAGLDRSDIDAVYIQDPTAVWPLQMLAHLGFQSPEDIGPWLAERPTYPGGSFPVNTNGGQLSEAYMWGWLHIFESVQQLRGKAGQRQIDGARTALYASTFAFVKAAASILVRGDS
jgi:acetyl-CoA acetyltransferase